MTTSTHVEGFSLDSGGMIAINAGNEVVATSAHIKDAGGHVIYGEKKVTMQEIVKTQTNDRHKSYLGGLFTSNKHSVDNSQRMISALHEWTLRRLQRQ